MPWNSEVEVLARGEGACEFIVAHPSVQLTHQNGRIEAPGLRTPPRTAFATTALPRACGGTRDPSRDHEGVTVSPAVKYWPSNIALMVTVAACDCGCVLTVKVVLVTPAGTVTLDGTLATEYAWSLDRLATVPPEGAGLINRMVPVTVRPPRTHAGESDTESGVEVDGWMVMLAVWVACEP